MADLLTWNGHTWKVDAQQVYAFKSLTIKASSDTEDKTKSKQKYVSRKNSKAWEITLTLTLDARLGISDVQTDALALSGEAFNGSNDYFYVSGKKVVNCKFMLTQADIDTIEMLPSGKWLSCQIKCTWKQCGLVTDENAAATTTKKKSSSKKSSKKSGTSAKTTTTVKDYMGSGFSKSSKTKYIAGTVQTAKSSSAKRYTTKTKSTAIRKVLSKASKRG